MTEAWKNWSGDLVCTPGMISTPSTEAEVLSLVRSAARDGRTVRVVGSGHSSMPIATTDGGTLVSLARMQGLVGIDPGQPAATLRAGTKIWAAGDPLLASGYSMVTMGDIDRQAIAGAVGTATHGSGPTLGNISSAVTVIRMVTGAGEAVVIDANSDPDGFRAARVSMGSMGVMSEVTIRVLPAYKLHERVVRVPFGECLDGIDEKIADNRHFEFFWYSEDDIAEMKFLNITEADPSTIDGRPGERIGWSPHIIPSVRERRFHEMEYSVPAENGLECFQRVRDRMRTRHPDVLWPVEYRTVAHDDAFLSPHFGRPSVTISIHQDARRPYADFFGDIEPIFLEHGGRPHWGKVNFLDRKQLREKYPHWDDFVRARNRFDPEGVMLSPYLRGLFASD